VQETNGFTIAQLTLRK